MPELRSKIMKKEEDSYLDVDAYKIIEKGFHIDNSQVSESIFSLGNEYCGIRGAFEEGSQGLRSLRGTYFNGIYEYAKQTNSVGYKGVVRRTHFMINSVDWIACRIEAENEVLDLSSSDFSNFRRELDMTSGLLTRTFNWKLKDKTNIKITFRRLLSMTSCHKAFQEIEFTSDRKTKINLILTLNSNVLHFGKDCYWKNGQEKKLGDGIIGLSAYTLTTGQKLVSAMKVDIQNESYKTDFSELRVDESYHIDLSANKTFSLVRYVVNLIDKNGHQNEEIMFDEAQNELGESSKNGIDYYIEENKKFWSDIYDKSDIVIDGDLKEQQGIRFCIFQLTQAYHGYSSDDNIGAKGLTGEAYSGHAFWDSETYCLPYFLLSNISAAKDLLMFRYATLKQAKERALELDCHGACYPIATLNGQEGCDLWQHASLQFQPSTGVAYGVFHYFNLTGDEEFLKKYGLEMLLEISHFLIDRGQWDNDKKYFGYYCVMGPDEFEMMVNNNTYTNYMAQRTFDYTQKIFKKYGTPEILAKCGLNKKFLSEIRNASQHMKILYDCNTDLFEQHEGYYSLPHIDINSIPKEDFPLYSHWSYDHIYRNDMIKQPDVLMFMFLYSSSFTIEQKKANYEFYEPRCIHESSLSPSIHSIFASELGKEKEALCFFSYATRLDLDDYNRNTSEGLHTTSLAAAYMNIVYGFGGLRTDQKIIKINPTLPASWKSYSFSFNYKGSHAKVLVTKKDINILVKGNELKLNIYGKLCHISHSLVLVRKQ